MSEYKRSVYQPNPPTELPMCLPEDCDHAERNWPGRMDGLIVTALTGDVMCRRCGLNARIDYKTGEFTWALP